MLFFYTFYQWLQDDTAAYSLTRVFFSGLLYLTLATAMVLTVACRNRGVVTSGVLFNFWLLLAVCGLPEFRYKLEASLSGEVSWLVSCGAKLHDFRLTASTASSCGST